MILQLLLTVELLRLSMLLLLQLLLLLLMLLLLQLHDRLRILESDAARVAQRRRVTDR